MVNSDQGMKEKSTGADTGLAVRRMPGVEDASGNVVAYSEGSVNVGVDAGVKVWQPITMKIKNSNNHFFVCIIPPGNLHLINDYI